MRLVGNIVAGFQTKFGWIGFEKDKISEITLLEEVHPDADWILPGFIDLHLHGFGKFNVEEGEPGLRGMAEFLATKGVTRFLPSYSSAPHGEILEFVKLVRRLAAEPVEGAKIAGSHIEGPWLALRFCGGMIPEMLRDPDLKQTQDYLDAACGTLKMMTIAPELPGALEVIRLLHQNGVVVSCGHSACPPDFLKTAVDAGVSEICHLFDSYALPEDHGGVRQPALTDLVLIHDGLMKEIIMDGLHVPPELVILARRAAGADHIIAITDALQGAGLKEGHFLDCGKPYHIKEGDFARRDEDNTIIGSSLSMNRAFFNMTTRFGFTPAEAALSLSANPAKQLKIDAETGSLQVGKLADIAVLAPDRLTVKATYLAGKKIF
ncbi:MAG: N-acetylglucosamine-6-phosphate deacetylase [Victivallaceae bacterium]|nr:N-acetylglucosamine-6-phosphate deacetylase [Victivallaceae bacterium]